MGGGGRRESSENLHRTVAGAGWHDRSTRERRPAIFIPVTATNVLDTQIRPPASVCCRSRSLRLLAAKLAFITGLEKLYTIIHKKLHKDLAQLPDGRWKQCDWTPPVLLNMGMCAAIAEHVSRRKSSCICYASLTNRTHPIRRWIERNALRVRL